VTIVRYVVQKKSVSFLANPQSFPKDDREREGFDMATFLTMGSASYTHGYQDVAPLELDYRQSSES
jgi:hypothetical protein